MPAPITRDYFAELYVAGLFADAGWNIYLPNRDQGFDIIVTKMIDDTIKIYPVQVKGLYPTDAKTDKTVYGFVGKLSAVHDDMILAMPYFPTDQSKPSPDFTAFMPYDQIKVSSRGYRCQPAQYKEGSPRPRRDFVEFFDARGLDRIEKM